MSVMYRLKQVVRAYFDTRANFKKEACRLVADELDDVYIGRALDRRYIDYVEDSLNGRSEILPFEIWLNNLETKNYPRLVEIVRPGFRDAVLKTIRIRRIFDAEGALEVEASGKPESVFDKINNLATTYRALVTAVFLVGAICGALAAAHLGYSPAEIGEILETKIIGAATAQ